MNGGIETTKRHNYIGILCVAFLLGAFFVTPAFAITESEVEAQAEASGKGAVVGNVLVWFLCAVAFLKVSQKIDSFMQSIGLNVGHTGGSLIAEALIATRGVKALTGATGKMAGGGGGTRTGSTGGIGEYFKGGLVGMASRRAANNAIKTATNNTTVSSSAFSSAASATHTTQQSAAQTAGGVNPVPAPSPEQMPGLSDQTDRAPILAETPPEQVNAPVPTELTVPGEPAPAIGAAAAASESEEQPPVILHDGAPVSASREGAQQAEASGGVVIEGASQTPGVPNPVESPQPIPDGSAAESPSTIEQTDAFSTEQTTVQGAPGGVIQTGETARTQTSEKSSAQSESRTAERSSTVSSTTHTARSPGSHTSSVKSSFKSYGIGGAMFMKSLASGGSFAHEVISRVARGDIQSTGTISGEMAAHALNSYMGVTALGTDAGTVPRYSNVEIGGGRISGVETPAGTHQDAQFCMYDASQYVAPQGEHIKVVTADGATWYKQYAQDAVDRKPHYEPDGSVGYEEKIVKRMPNPPQRKARI